MYLTFIYISILYYYLFVVFYYNICIWYIFTSAYFIYKINESDTNERIPNWNRLCKLEIIEVIYNTTIHLLQ